MACIKDLPCELLINLIKLVLKVFIRRRISSEGSDEIEQVYSILCETYQVVEEYGCFDDIQEFGSRFFFIKSNIKEKLQCLRKFVPNIQMYMNKKAYRKFEHFYYRLNERFALLEKEIDFGEPNDLIALVEAQDHYNVFVRDLLSEQYKHECDDCLRRLKKLLGENDFFID